MKLSWLRLIIQVGLIITFFFPMMHQKDVEEVVFTGFDAITQGDYLIIGNIVIGLIFLGVIIHFVGIMVEMIQKKPTIKWIEGINMIVNITAILSLVMFTFLGTFLEFLGFVYVSLLILSTYLRYVDQKNLEK
ncbi:MAG: hypothetical protein A2Y45_03040 [Tenericutes bacterium GWC2_34_14]|nr:MAG: hypothetical protein A2Z84_03985 [Tenericutes bacterium GWA2_35_7]OHE29028.1 MAG: hypothetical protein A2Y45_03040 [Tenericutes bacterium GWC2_34_14]OHE33981.1 MAG: hypothetical protein A2012_06580 [Tenericutes bacterium GWE2_34_108]OHE35314.1 MAG: hypothetical protein A2Y46_04300 [Tenericutes bacterium GWF1_35_14]OHE38347.1 MAG: hypothetical protein A2Y44_03610 [Tenericutes bacterium GWF2_35_184]OHE42682.1 MAG: hypothetical protein A2221_08240 [Tenericutes bacterium RIFOXYA2_FULL_36_3